MTNTWTAIIGFCLVACGGLGPDANNNNNTPASPVDALDQEARVSQLSATDVRTLCEFGHESAGNRNSATCGSKEVTLPTVDQCAASASHNQCTVANMERCYRSFKGSPCNSASVPCRELGVCADKTSTTS